MDPSRSHRLVHIINKYEGYYFLTLNNNYNYDLIYVDYS